jgi:hypothetical protein
MYLLKMLLVRPEFGVQISLALILSHVQKGFSVRVDVFDSRLMVPGLHYAI